MEIGRNKYRLLNENLPLAYIQEALHQLKKDRIIERIWEKDHTVWSDRPEEIADRLGWLESYHLPAESLREIQELVEQARSAGYTDALLVGMGGSSMAPEVFSRVFGAQDGWLELHVLDSTDPGAVLDMQKRLDPYKTLFIVSTKSGGTVETVSLMKYFYNTTVKAVGIENTGEHFIAITDPGSSLEKAARELNFRKIFLNNPHIGGRYSALSYFGLVPAALTGVDLEKLLQNAEAMAVTARTSKNPLEGGNTAAWLGAALGILGDRGRNKITLILSPPIQPFGAWIEQLIAESTGKDGKGLLPVDGETLAEPESYAFDRLFIYFRLDGNTVPDDKVLHLKDAGHPVIQLSLQDKYDLGGEFFRWMMATAVAGWAMDINPFDQPNVESAKILARDMVSAYRDRGELPAFKSDLEVDGISVYAGFGADDLAQVWRDFMLQANPGTDESKDRSYVAIQAYLKPNPETDRVLQVLRDTIQTRYRMAVTVGYGPRFLHSTGQLHKGDAGNGLFIQLTAAEPEDVAIPARAGIKQSSISFGVLKAAQALGDRQALLDAGRKVIRFHFDRDIKAAIEKLAGAVPRAGK